MKKFFKMMLVALTVFGLNACASMSNNTATPERYGDLHFDNKAPIPLLVKTVNIKSEFTPSFTRPNVEHLFPISIEKTARLWAHDRLEAVDYSSPKTAKVIIKDASVTEELEPVDGVFEKDRLKYRATLYIIIRVTDGNDLSSAGTEIEAWRELTIPADTPIEDKEKYWNKMVYDLFNDFNQRMDYNIRKYLNVYVANSNDVANY